MYSGVARLLKLAGPLIQNLFDVLEQNQEEELMDLVTKRLSSPIVYEIKVVVSGLLT